MSKFSYGNKIVKSRQKFINSGGVQKTKNFPSKGGGSQNLGTVPKLYLVINYDGSPKLDPISQHFF